MEKAQLSQLTKKTTQIGMSICDGSVPNSELFEEWAAKKVDLPKLSECFELRRTESLGIHAVARWAKFGSNTLSAPPFQKLPGRKWSLSRQELCHHQVNTSDI